MKKVVCLTLALVMVIGLVACGSTTKEPAPTADPAADPIVIRAGLIDTSAELETVPSSMALVRFFEAVEERTNGAVTFEVFPDGQLAGNGEQALIGAQNGALDLFSLSTGSWGSYTNGFSALALPFLFSNTDEVAAFYNSDYIKDTLYSIVEKDTGMKVLGCFDIGFRQFTSNSPVHSVADLKGMKVRVMNDPIQIAAWDALGCSTQVVNWNELFTALQQGVVDAQENPLSNIKVANLQQVQKYLTLTNHVFASTAIVISAEKWATIPAEYQQIIEEEIKNASDWGRNAIIESEASILEELGQAMEIIELSAEALAEFAELARESWTVAEESIGADIIESLRTVTVELFK